MSRKPLSVLHMNFDKKDGFAELVAKAVKVCHMDRGEAALLLFYASCSSGFSPSAQLIAEKCGVKKNYVACLRQKLIDKGIITIVNDNVVLDWRRIKVISSLNPKLTDKNGWVKPIPPVGLDRLSKFMERWPSALDLYTLPMDTLIERLGSMPQWVYNGWRAQVNRDLKRHGIIRINQILG